MFDGTGITLGDDVITGPSAIIIFLNFWHYSHGSGLSHHPIGVGQVSCPTYRWNFHWLIMVLLKGQSFIGMGTTVSLL